MDNYYNLREYGVSNDVLLNSDITFIGENFFVWLHLNDLNITGQSTFIQPPSSIENQVDIPKFHLVTKDFVDTLDTNLHTL